MWFAQAYSPFLLLLSFQIAPGICLEVIAELLAVEEGTVMANIVISHKAHTIHVPIAAEVAGFF